MKSSIVTTNKKKLRGTSKKNNAFFIRKHVFHIFNSRLFSGGIRTYHVWLPGDCFSDWATDYVSSIGRANTRLILSCTISYLAKSGSAEYPWWFAPWWRMWWWCRRWEAWSRQGTCSPAEPLNQIKWKNWRKLVNADLGAMFSFNKTLRDSSLILWYYYKKWWMISKILVCRCFRLIKM